jgi:hypothetical protein
MRRNAVGSLLAVTHGAICKQNLFTSDNQQLTNETRHAGRGPDGRGKRVRNGLIGIATGMVTATMLYGVVCRDRGDAMTFQQPQSPPNEDDDDEVSRFVEAAWRAPRCQSLFVSGIQNYSADASQRTSKPRKVSPSPPPIPNEDVPTQASVMTRSTSPLFPPATVAGFEQTGIFATVATQTTDSEMEMHAASTSALGHEEHLQNHRQLFWQLHELTRQRDELEAKLEAVVGDTSLRYLAGGNANADDLQLCARAMEVLATARRAALGSALADYPSPVADSSSSSNSLQNAQEQRRRNAAIAVLRVVDVADEAVAAVVPQLQTAHRLRQFVMGMTTLLTRLTDACHRRDLPERSSKAISSTLLQLIGAHADDVIIDAGLRNDAESPRCLFDDASSSSTLTHS